MSLTELWKKSGDTLLQYPIDKILSVAGDSNLLDNSECSKELRAFLGEAPEENILNYAQNCLDGTFKEKGLVLQDVVNEIGRRLDFDVENGLYQGRSNAIGYDGIWRNNGGSADILVEVKKASHIVIQLSKIANYKNRLISEKKISENASVLIVIGNENTEEIESQIRGSDYAREMRIISVRGLSNLLRIKQKSNEDETVNKIKEILQPFEYIKIDNIIDIIFTTTADVESQDDGVPDTEDEDKHTTRKHVTNLELINEKRDVAIKSLGKKLNVSFLQHRRILFWNREKTQRAQIAVSKRHAASKRHTGGSYYWYAYHDRNREFLEGGEESYIVFTCADKDTCFAIPYRFLKENINNLSQSANKNGQPYWHILIYDKGTKGMFWKMLKGKKESLSKFAIPMITESGEPS